MTPFKKKHIKNFCIVVKFPRNGFVKNILKTILLIRIFNSVNFSLICFFVVIKLRENIIQFWIIELFKDFAHFLGYNLKLNIFLTFQFLTQEIKLFT